MLLGRKAPQHAALAREGVLHSFSTQNTKRYRYYVCSYAQDRGYDRCDSKSIPAEQLEQFVVGRIKSVVGDVSFGTMRTVAVVSGNRGLAWLFGLLEVMIWVFAVSAVIAHIRTEPAYGVAFAIGAATGKYFGVTLQRWLPFGDQVVRIFTRKGTALFDELRRTGFGVTEFQGVGWDGPVSMLFVQVRRARAALVVRAARRLDPGCFYTIDNIRVANAAMNNLLPTSTQP